MLIISQHSVLAKLYMRDIYGSTRTMVFSYGKTFISTIQFLFLKMAMNGDEGIVLF